GSTPPFRRWIGARAATVSKRSSVRRLRSRPTTTSPRGRPPPSLSPGFRPPTRRRASVRCSPTPVVRVDRASTSSTPPARRPTPRSEEHTSELQSRENLVCRLLLEKKKKKITNMQETTRNQKPTE